MAIAIPAAPGDLTATWLTAVLAKAFPFAPIVERVSVAPIGTGQTASAFRLSVDYETVHPELPRTFVVKLPSQDLAVRERVAPGCRSEVSFYESVAETVRIPLPECFYSAIAEEGASFVLLLSDLAPSAQGDQIAGCTPMAARAAVTALAGLHGPGWCDPRWSDASGVVMSKPNEASAIALAEFARIATDQFLATLGPQLSPACQEVLDEHPDVLADWLLLKPSRFSILHGDYRLDNIMFSPDQGRVHVVDWQTMAVGLPARDLAYFIATSLHPDERSQHELDLVRSYHEALLSEGVASYSLEDCWEDYRLGMLQVPMISTLGWAFSATTDRGDEMMVTMVERATAAINDLDTLRLVRSVAADAQPEPHR